MVLLSVGCATAKPQIVEIELTKAFEPQSVEAHIPSEFENTMPSSSLILNSLVVFDQSYAKVFSDGDIISVSGNDKLISVLKKNEIHFTMPSCSALITGEGFYSVSNTGFIAFVDGVSSVQLYSAYDCVMYQEYEKVLRGKAYYINGYIIEVAGTKVAIRQSDNGRLLYNGDVGTNVATAGMIGGKPVVVLDNNYIMGFSDDKNTFSLLGQFPLAFNMLRYSEGMFYGVNSNGNFFTMTDDDTRQYPLTDCVLSQNSPYALCGTTLIGKDGDFYENVDIDSNNFSVGIGMVAELSNNNLNVFALNRAWQRSIQFSYTMPKPCLASDGAVYIKGFSGDIFRYAEGIETKVSEMPTTCDSESVRISLDKLLCNNSECGKFAKVIKQNNEYYMMNRVENGKQYYYFLAK